MTDGWGLKRIRQIALTVDNLARATSFYRDVLGVPLLFDAGNLVFFDCDGTWLMLGLPEGGVAGRGGAVLYFEVADIQAAHAGLEARGVRFLEAPHFIADMGSYELWMAFFRDPDGNTLAIRSEVPKDFSV